MYLLSAHKFYPNRFFCWKYRKASFLIVEMEARLGGLEEETTRLNHELEEASQRAGTVEVYEEKRKEIEDKVGGLLEKLEALG